MGELNSHHQDNCRLLYIAVLYQFSDNGHEHRKTPPTLEGINGGTCLVASSM